MLLRRCSQVVCRKLPEAELRDACGMGARLVAGRGVETGRTRDRRQVAARSHRADRGKNHDPSWTQLIQKPRLSATPACPGGQTGKPPARAAPSLVRALRDARGALLFATGTSLPQRQRGILFARRSTGHGEETASSGKNSLATCGAIKERKTAFPAPNKKRSAQSKTTA